ncbi:DUF2157 domain-containing protein [Myroides marinus]|uniref:DUF2157 domain-containing protein n=1 Tax=Myroides marinus TaxID=703342 RepID=UPI002576FFC6|nr:DUF2157 domain-containing protein [Myroides marinus]MDM1346727.1 DUF2157 domain-containing protein [Myroides marinus]
MKEKIDKGDLYLLKEHSTLSDIQLGELLEQKSYADYSDWNKFIKYFTLVLGAGFLISGIIFFFAYNWADLNKYAKFGLIFSLLVLSVGGAVYAKASVIVKQVCLLSASVLVGVLFAVYGQVYQTGANAYDLFLMWVLAITPWTVLNKFTPHWLVYAVLANTTLALYFIQVKNEDMMYYSILFMLVLNIALYFVPVLLGKVLQFKLDKYYMGIVTLACSAIAAAGVMVFIFVDYDHYSRADLSGLNMLVIGASLWLIASCLWSLKTKNLLLFSYFLIAVFSIIFAVLIKIADVNEGSLLLFAIYSIGGTFGVVKLIMNQKKLWNNEQ